MVKRRGVRCRLRLLAAVAMVAGWVATFASVPARAEPEATSVAVIHGDQSLPNDGERRFAAALARHALRWLNDAGVEGEVFSDARLSQGLADRRVALLVYCARPTSEQIRLLRGFLGRGGKLIVCYSMSVELAQLMGVALGEYERDMSGGRWVSMRFVQDRPVNAPGMVRQNSPNLHKVSPVAGRSRVLAWWHDRDGRRTGEVAWLRSAEGFWMSHVLLGDGDASAKSRLLLALVGDIDPAIWHRTARRRLATFEGDAPWQNPDRALRAAEAVSGFSRRRRARADAQRALNLRTEAHRLLAVGRGAEAWRLAEDMRDTLMRSYGHMQQPAAGEIRAVWDHSGLGLYPGDWSRTCRILRAAGVSDLFVNVAGPGFTHCRIDSLPASPAFQTHGDQLQACLAAARPLGLRVHAWLICGSTTRAGPERLEQLRRRGWLLQGTDGKPRDWLNPALPDVRAFLVQVAAELLDGHDVDGLHLDFVRYPDFHESLGPDTRRLFETRRGAAVPAWPESVRKGPLFHEFVAWRAEQIALLVSEMRTMQRLRAPGIWLTAAVYGKHPSCLESVGQAWERWIETGSLDYAVPMNYTEDEALYRSLVTTQTRSYRLRNHLIGGIGVTAAESRLDAARVIDQVNLLRQQQAAGFALFDLDTTLEQEILPVLKLGLTAPGARR